MTISDITWGLLKFSKSNIDEFSYMELHNYLAPIYHTDMKLDNVMAILLQSLHEVINETKFKISYGDKFLNQIILSPLKLDLWKTPANKIELMYNTMIVEILNGFRFTTIDWCKEELLSSKY